MEINSKLHYADICEVSQEVLCIGEAVETFKQMAVEWPFACNYFHPGSCLMCA